MRIHFDRANFSSATGPNTFATRLAKALFNLGHEVATDNGPAADVSLVFIERTGAPLAPRVVQRLDGIWFKPADFHTKNVGIRALYRQADAVVFQSDFDRRMAIRWWGPPALNVVVHNGIDLTQTVGKITIPKLAELRAAYDRVYVASSNWHPQKRLGANVTLFNHLRRRQPNSCLVVLGANADMRVAAGNPHVFFTGSVDADTYLQVYSAADWLLHLAWADHCPNVVVEALSQGTPVACSEVGGTKELVGGYGQVYREQPYDYELFDYDRPPDVDVAQFDDLPPRQQLPLTHANVDIVRAADAYVGLFRQLAAT